MLHIMKCDCLPPDGLCCTLSVKILFSEALLAQEIQQRSIVTPRLWYNHVVKDLVYVSFLYVFFMDYLLSKLIRNASRTFENMT